MKPTTINVNLLKLISALGVSSGFLLGCGGPFESSAISPKAPPVTSDPWTAEQQSAWDSFQDFEETEGSPFLQTEMERESFLEDITEQKRTHSDEDLAVDAEDQFEKNEKERQEKEKEKKAAESLPDSEQKPEPLPETQPREKTKPEELKPPEEIKPQEPKTTEKKPEAPKAEPKKPEEKSPKVRPPSIKSEFCEGLNVASGRGEVDLSALYNENSTLPLAMPSQALKSSNTLNKKNSFICILLPIAIRMNEQVYRQRLEVLRLQKKTVKGATLAANEQEWLGKIKVAYGLSAKHSNEELLKRVDIIPLPLMLAQAALESGWGTSRASRELNNLFGMHAGPGQPCERGRAPGSACIRKFPTLVQGVSAYIRLLNAGNPYGPFRERRYEFRRRNEPLDSLKLLETLGRYNESPEKYIREVRDMMIHHNKLTQFNFKEEKVRTSF